MDIVSLWKFGHVAAMFFAVSIFVGQGMLERAVARSGDVRALRRVLAAEERFGPLGGAMFLLGIVLGLVTAISGRLDLTQPWLVIGYVVAAAILVIAVVYTMPTTRRLAALAIASPDDQPSSELRRAIDAPAGLYVTIADGLLWLAVIFVMAVKPFS